MRRILLPPTVLLILVSFTFAAPNPSAVYCIECGYEYQNRTDPTGGQYGVCIFPDGSECMAWSFWRRCNSSHCTQESCDCHWPCPGPATIIYVDADATGANDGSNWTNAHTSLQDALENAKTSKRPIEIRVAQGTYQPDKGNQQTPGDRVAAFELINDTAIKGGYAGFSSLDPNDRNIELYQTILTGDLSGNDADINDLRLLSNDPTRSENSYHLVVSLINDSSAIIDGLTITAGNANGPKYTQTYGGGMYVDSSNAIIANCTFHLNSASGRGGGFFSQTGQNILFRCNFSSNCSYLGAGVCATKIEDLIDCSFEYNIASLNGGGMWGRARQVSGCSFIANQADQNGGGLFNNANATFTNCLFANNQADRGGGLYAQDCDITLSNCTISHNSASQYAGLHNDEGDTILTNSILWTNTDTSGSGQSAQIETAFAPVINYSCIQNWTGNLGGSGNFSSDPLFADPNAADFHLKSQAGQWDTASLSWLQENVTSPCIDAGNPSGPIGPEPFPNGGFVNLGAYGATTQASKTWFAAPLCETIIAGDINGDCVVNFTDFTIMAMHWLTDNTLQ